ncbi:MAG: 16S rRNA processing protein RimM [Bacteroidaceae bacterium]|nr:16S rRNA processing protein RimM [Bacteroidaceae bacterium]
MNIADFYKIGRIGRPHGINGEVQMTFTDDVFDRTDAEHVMILIDGLLVPFFFEEYRFRGEESALVKFEGVDTKEKAQTLTNCDVYFSRAEAEESGEYTWSQLVGYTITAKGRLIGTITNIDTSTENYLFELSPARKGRGEILIPVAEEWIEDINHDEHSIAMNLPEGLI